MITAIPESIESLPFPERIKRLAELAKMADPDFKVFGSKKHQYNFNAPTTVEKVRAFEERTGITLPKEYVDFLTTVGEGGAGIDYGLYTLDEAEKYTYVKECASEGLTLFDYEDHERTYYYISKMMEDLDEKLGAEAEDQLDKLFADIIRGMVIIGTAGCTYDYFIMCSGTRKGYVGMLDWNMMTDLKGGPTIFDLKFNDWIEDHFRRIILGKLCSRGSFDAVDKDAEIPFPQRDRSPIPSPIKKDVVSGPAPTDMRAMVWPKEPSRISTPTPAPAPQTAPPPSPQPTAQFSSSPDPTLTPRPTPAPAPAPVPKPAPAPAPKPVHVYRSGDFVKHTKYGNGIITNAVNVGPGKFILTIDFLSNGTKNVMIPYDEKDLTCL